MIKVKVLARKWFDQLLLTDECTVDSTPEMALQKLGYSVDEVVFSNIDGSVITAGDHKKTFRELGYPDNSVLNSHVIVSERKKDEQEEGRIRTLLRYKEYIDNVPYCEEAHHHVCLACQILGSDVEKVCTKCPKDKSLIGITNECDRCKYLAIVETDHGNMKITAHSEICDTFKRN